MVHKSPEPNTPAYALGTYLAGEQRAIFNTWIGRILTQIDAAMPASDQATALKQLLKQELWQCNEATQAAMYEALVGANISSFKVDHGDALPADGPVGEPNEMGRQDFDHDKALKEN